jgi:hypothetical protein
MLEKAEMVSKANDRQNLLYIDDEAIADEKKDAKVAPVMNVILLKNEVDLE